MAPSMAYGPAVPKPSASTSPPHHGQSSLRLVWAQSIFCAHSTIRYSTPKSVTFFYYDDLQLSHPICHQSSHSPPPTPQHSCLCHLLMWDQPFLEHRPPALSSLPPRCAFVGWLSRCAAPPLLPLSIPSTASTWSRRDLSLVVVASRGLSPSHLPPSPPPPPPPRMP